MSDDYTSPIEKIMRSEKWPECWGLYPPGWMADGDFHIIHSVDPVYTVAQAPSAQEAVRNAWRSLMEEE